LTPYRFSNAALYNSRRFTMWVMSTACTIVTCALVWMDCTMWSAMVRRMDVIGTTAQRRDILLPRGGRPGFGRQRTGPHGPAGQVAAAGRAA
jgi:hypothetical protein